MLCCYCVAALVFCQVPGCIYQVLLGVSIVLFWLCLILCVCFCVCVVCDDYVVVMTRCNCYCDSACLC